MVGFRFCEISPDYGTRAGPGATIGGVSRCAAANARGRLATHAAAQAATGAAARGRLFFCANVSNPAAFGRRDVVAARWRRA
ncbi:dgpf domain protein [Burkholderia pseudomallei 668]|nr:dgpf domain protein [Burkholderia pseudomallei 668]